MDRRTPSLASLYIFYRSQTGFYGIVGGWTTLIYLSILIFTLWDKSWLASGPFTPNLCLYSSPHSEDLELVRR